MDFVPVESSMITAVGYDPTSQELEIEFRSGRIYRYIGVPVEVYEGLLAAESKGQYMHAYVLDVYPYHPVSRRRRR